MKDEIVFSLLWTLRRHVSVTNTHHACGHACATPPLFRYINFVYYYYYNIIIIITTPTGSLVYRWALSTRRQIYRERCGFVNTNIKPLLNQLVRTVTRTKYQSVGGNRNPVTKFYIIRSAKASLPQHWTTSELAEQFGDFFNNKTIETAQCIKCNWVKMVTYKALYTFNVGSTSCADLAAEEMARFSASFNHTHHQSISLGRRGLCHFKMAHIKPLLKRLGLDAET